MTARLSAFKQSFSLCNVDAFLVCHDVDIFYLSGFPSHESWLLVTIKGAYFITDARYSLEAAQGLKETGIQVVESKRGRLTAMLSMIKRDRVNVLGLDERHMSVAVHRCLRDAKPASLELKAMNGLLDKLRCIKTPYEILAIKESIKVNLEAYRYLENKINPDCREKDLLIDLERFVRENNVVFSFPPIIASGPNSAMPHARVTERKISLGEWLLVDMGIEKNAYKSDLTRMFFLGKMTCYNADLLSHVREAQITAIKAIRPGVLAKDVDAVARKYLNKKGLGSNFTHSLGHGVGLEVHEMPAVSRKSEFVLAESMVFTVEPGIYFPGEFGIRLEEMVLVTKTGCEVLSVDYDH